MCKDYCFKKRRFDVNPLSRDDENTFTSDEQNKKVCSCVYNLDKRLFSGRFLTFVLSQKKV